MENRRMSMFDFVVGFVVSTLLILMFFPTSVDVDITSKIDRGSVFEKLESEENSVILPTRRIIIWTDEEDGGVSLVDCRWEPSGQPCSDKERRDVLKSMAKK